MKANWKEILDYSIYVELQKRFMNSRDSAGLCLFRDVYLASPCLENVAVFYDSKTATLVNDTDLCITSTFISYTHTPRKTQQQQQKGNPVAHFLLPIFVSFMLQ